MNRILLPLLILIAIAFTTQAQEVKNTSYTSASGEKVLRIELILPLSRAEAWQYFSNDKKIMLWMAPLAHIDLRSGGTLVTNYDKSKSLKDKSAISSGIINYIDKELLTLKVNLNDAFTKKAQQEDGNLQEIIQLIPVDSKHTKIVSSMIGWGKGPDWDKTYSFFVKGNIYTYKELTKLFH